MGARALQRRQALRTAVLSATAEAFAAVDACAPPYRLQHAPLLLKAKVPLIAESLHPLLLKTRTPYC